MKKLLTSILLGLALSSSIALADVSTNTSTTLPAVPMINSPSSIAQIATVGSQLAKDGYATLKGLSFKNGIKAEPFALYHKGDYGAGIAISTTATNSLNYGFAIAAVQETVVHPSPKNQLITSKEFNFYDTSFSVSYNGITDLPVIGRCEYFAETGAAIDAKNPMAGIYNQSAAGLKKTWDINGNVSFTVGGGALYLSKWNDVAYIGFAGLTTQMHGQHLFGIW